MTVANRMLSSISVLLVLICEMQVQFCTYNFSHWISLTTKTEDLQIQHHHHVHHDQHHHHHQDVATGSVLDVEVLNPGPAVLAVPAEAGVAPSAPLKNL